MTFESRRREPSRLYRLQLSVRQKVVGPYGPMCAAPDGTARRRARRMVRPYVAGATSARPTGGLSRGPPFRTPLE